MVIYWDLSPQSQVLPRVELESSSGGSCSSLRFEPFLVPSSVDVGRIQVLLGGGLFACVEEFQRVKQKQLGGLIKKHFRNFYH